MLALTLSSVQGTLLDDIKRSWNQDPQLQTVIRQIKEGHPSPFTWKNELLLKGGKLVIGKDDGLRREILRTFYSSSIAGHSGINATIKRIASFCFLKGLEKDVGNNIRECDVCQRCKYDPRVPRDITSAPYSHCGLDGNQHGFYRRVAYFPRL